MRKGDSKTKKCVDEWMSQIERQQHGEEEC